MIVARLDPAWLSPPLPDLAPASLAIFSPPPRCFSYPARCVFLEFYSQCVPPLLSILQGLPVASSRKSNFLLSDSGLSSLDQAAPVPATFPGVEEEAPRRARTGSLQSGESAGGALFPRGKPHLMVCVACSLLPEPGWKLVELTPLL